MTDNVTYILFFLLIAAVIVFVLVRYLYNNNNKTITKSSQELDEKIKDLSVESILNFQQISNDDFDESKLVLISDNKVIDTLQASIPAFTSIGSDMALKNKINADNIYKVIIPTNQQLMESKSLPDTFKGIYGKGNIEGHADLVKINPKDLKKIASISNVMAITSMAVGQYHMQEISAKLNEISKDVKEISAFQQRELKSEIITIYSEVKEMVNFKYEILKNAEVRNQKIILLDNLRRDSKRVLNQVNLALNDIFKDSKNSDFAQYEISINKINILLDYQRKLLDIINIISDLNYVLHQGSMSKEHANNSYYEVKNMSMQSFKNLKIWHNKEIIRFGINIENRTRNNEGIEGFIKDTISIFNSDWKNTKIDDNLVLEIKNQSINNIDIIDISEKDILNQEIPVIVKDNKYYMEVKS
ncbi:hypothetical protein [Mycoplasma sp. P36-A1]|uniref:hypothetical protein n=1 Tax=Mycoplasma sp. P36-A1 TaxID=3252900 RepID=UPI003C300F91